MKSTGVVRRIDDLGRIVVPKEIRRTLKIRDGESLEIFVDKDIIILKKFSSLSDMADLSKKLIESLDNSITSSVYITDMDQIISSKSEKSIGTEITDFMRGLIDKRENYENLEKKSFSIIDGYEINGYIMVIPIIVNSDTVGSILFVSNLEKISEIEKKIAIYIGKVLEKNLAE